MSDLRTPIDCQEGTAPITVMLLTCPRPAARYAYARETLESFRAHVVYAGPLNLHIAHDGDPTDQHIYDLRDIARDGPFFDDVSVSVTGASPARGKGYGASYNLATQYINDRGGLVLPLEDDWRLTRDLDLGPLAEALTAPFENPDEGFGCIRLGYLGFWAPLDARFIHHANHCWARFDPASESADVFAGHPRLETVAFERRLGLWPEGLLAGETELAVSGRIEARDGVVWPTDFVATSGDLFAHIGTRKAGTE